MSRTVPLANDGVLALHHFAIADVDDHLAGEDEEHARRFGWHPARSTKTTVETTIHRWKRDWEMSGSTRAFAARETTTGVLIGGCELRLQDGHSAEMSYWIFPPHRGKGHGTRVVKLATDYAFSSLDVLEVNLFVEPDNLASLAVARKAGYLELGTALQSIGTRTAPVETLHFVRRKQAVT